MATYTIKIGSTTVATDATSSSLIGYPRGMYPYSRANTSWSSSAYCWAISVGGSTYYKYGVLQAPVTYSIPVQNRITTQKVDGLTQTTYYTTSASTQALENAVGESTSIANGATVYDANGNKLTVSITLNKEKYTISVVKCLDDGTQTQVSSKSYEDGTSVKVAIPSVYPNSVLSGVLVDSGAQDYSPGGYTVTANANKTILFKYTSTVRVSLEKGTGVSSMSGSATTSYTGVRTSASAGGSFNVELGTQISLSATASDGYVMHTGAISPSTTGYATISGDGGGTVNGSQICVSAVTFTATGVQYSISPTIVSTMAGWGSAKIRYASATEWTTGALPLKPNTSYELGFDSSTSDTIAAAVDYWSIGGSNYSTNTFTTGSTVTSDTVAYLYLRQTKWRLSVRNATSESWGKVYIGASGDATSGWFASGTAVPIRFVSSLESTIAPRIGTVTYNQDSQTVHGSTANVTTVASDGEAYVQLEKTKCLLKVALADETKSEWGTVSGGGVYVQNGSVVSLKFTPNPSHVSTFHPQATGWSFSNGQDSVSVVSAEDGSSTVSVTLSLASVTNDVTASCHLESAWRKVSVRRSDSGDAAWGSFYLGESGNATEAYYAPGTTIKVRYARDDSFDATVRPQVGTITVGAEATIQGVDGTYAYQYALPSNTKTDLAITGSLAQTAWPVTVRSTGNGSVTAKRVDIATSAVIASVTSTGESETVYLRSGSDAEYISLSTEGDEHYDFYSFSVTNLEDYGEEEGNYQLETPSGASASASFTRDDFKISVTSDLASVCEVYMQDGAASEAYYDKDVSNNPVVVCKIKSAYADQYKVKTFSIGSQSGVEAQYNSAAGIYYVEVSGRSDVIVTAHVVPTNYSLSVSVGPSNKSQFGRVILSSNGQELKDVSTDDFSGKVKEGARISVVFYERYGGKIAGIVTSDEIESPSINEHGVSFDMPSADCSVVVTLGAKQTYQMTVGVRNLAEGQAANIPGVVTVRSRTYPDTVIGSTTSDGTDKTFTVYRDEEYSLVLSPASSELSRRYSFSGWRDSSGAISGATDTTLNVINTTGDALVRYAGYSARENGTITVEWAKKDGETITALASAPTGCSLSILNTADKYDATHWLVGTDIVIPYEVRGSAYDQDGDAYKWTPVEVDVALAADAYAANATWDDDLLTQGGSFRMLGSMKVRVVLTQTRKVGYTSMHVGYRQSNALMGEVSVFSTEMDAYTQDSDGVTVLAQKERKAVVMAAPRPGYAFAGWFTKSEDGSWTAVSGAKAVYEISSVTSPMTVYYAQFVASTVSNVRMWNGNEDVAKTCEWQSKVYVGAQFFQMSACRVYSDAYPVTLKVMMSSSPDGVFGERAHTAEITIRNQDPRRLPMMRPEKYFAFKVTGYARINHVCIASSMEALK